MASLPTSILHMSFMITSEYNNYLVIFVEYNISFHQYCYVKYYKFNIFRLKNNYPGVYALIHMRTNNYENMTYCIICLTYVVEM